jgi:hypothetical protein
MAGGASECRLIIETTTLIDELLPTSLPLFHGSLEREPLLMKSSIAGLLR